MPKTVITGTGLISPAGLGADRLLDAMLAGTSFFSDTGKDQDSVPWPIAAVDWNGVTWPQGEFWSNNKKYANVAAHGAVSVAIQATQALEPTPDPVRTGCVMAISSSGSDELAGVIGRLAVQAETDPRPLATLLYEEVPDYSYIRGIPSQMGQFVAMATGARGSNVAVYGEAGAGGLGALALAVRLLDADELDRVIVVGVVPPMSLASLATIEKDEPLALTKGYAIRGPFDADRQGVLLGQAAVAIVVERAESARERGVPALAELLGCETISAQTRLEAASAAGHLVMEYAGCKPDVWWAAGMGSATLDGQECEALGTLVNAPVTTSKGTIGTAFEACALVDIAAAVAAMNRQVIPPVGHVRTPDPRLAAMDIVLGSARQAPTVRSALVTGMSVGASTTAGAAMLARSDDHE